MIMKHKCQAEDQAGWPCNSTPVVYRLTLEEVRKNDGQQMYFCKDHRTNKFVWREDESEPIPDNQHPDHVSQTPSGPCLECASSDTCSRHPRT